MTTVSIIVATDEHALIGCATGLPWHLPADLKRFRTLTMGKPIIMGRRTHEQIGRVLPGRTNIVLTLQREYQAPGCVVVHTVEEALVQAEECVLRDGADEIMVIGGAEIYRQFLALCRRIYLTLVEGEFEGNTWFPDGIPAEPKWRTVSSESFLADEKNRHPHRVVILERVD